MPKITASRLRRLLDYEPASGHFIWRANRKGHACKGELAGDLHPFGYWRIGIEGRRYRRARLAFLYMTGEWPPSEVDHINCDPTDDRWTNLRLATRQQQLANSRSRGRLKLKGVCFVKANDKYRAQIKVDQKNIWLGDFTTAQNAHAAYIIAAKKYFGEFARFS